jgi:hypothetical protein
MAVSPAPASAAGLDVFAVVSGQQVIGRGGSGAVAAAAAGQKTHTHGTPSPSLR